MSAVLALGAVACGGDDKDSSGGGDKVTLGFMGDLTGENSGIVIPPWNGAQLAVEQYNATNPKVKIELKRYDSQGKPEQATGLAQQAIKNDKIQGLIGPAFSGESQSVAPILDEAKIPSVSPSATNVTLGEKKWTYWHRVVADDEVQGAGASDFIARAFKAKKVFVVHDNQDYSKGLADYVTKGVQAKGATVATDVVDQKGTDYSSTVNKAKQAAPDVLFFGGYYAQAGRLFKQLREGGVTVPLVTGDGSLDGGLIKGTGANNANKVYVSCPCLIDPEGKKNPKAKTFNDAYKAKFNADVAIYSGEGFDAATAFIEAIKAGNTTPEKINQFLSTINIEGVAKPIKFESNGELAAKDIYVYESKGGKLPLLGNTKDATVK
ncbi:branched-chain amino acid ABC transporter substrate-binding protein [Actinomadura fulvescens]